MYPTIELGPLQTRVPSILRDLKAWCCVELPAPEAIGPNLLYVGGRAWQRSQGELVSPHRLATFRDASEWAVSRGMAGLEFVLLPEHRILIVQAEACFDHDGQLAPEVVRLATTSAYSEYSQRGNDLVAYFENSGLGVGIAAMVQRVRRRFNVRVVPHGGTAFFTGYRVATLQAQLEEVMA